MASEARVYDLGVLSYESALARQLETYEEVAAGAPDTLLFVEHPAVLTLGASFHEENLLHPRAFYESRGIGVLPTDRGGDVTYHGPGQLVAYPIFDLTRHDKDLHKWLRDLEEAIIASLAFYDLAGYRFPPNTGVWVAEKKVAAIGVKIKRWINLHGIALNCSVDLSVYDLFVPCGIRDYGVTSLSELTGREITVRDAKSVVRQAFAGVFQVWFPD